MTLRLVHTFGRNAGLVATPMGDVVRFGRAKDNDVVFDADHDRDASGHHAELRREGGAWVLVDLGSRNGTFLRGMRVAREVVASGDEIGFGAKGPRVRVELAAGIAPPTPTIAEAPAHAVAAALPMAPPAGARVGQRTLAYLVSQAVAAATGRRPGRTREIEALVDAEVNAAIAPHRRTTIALGVLLVFALSGLVALVVWSRSSDDDIATLRGELASLPPGDPRRKEIEGRLGTLHPSNASFGRNLYDRSKKGIFMLAARGEGFCTAFAVRPSVLATNAHCVFAARRAGGAVTALENEGRGEVGFAVTDMKPHPLYRDGDAANITPDVAVVTIAGKAAVTLELATKQELAGIGAGDDVYLIGFPGTLMDPQNPAATFLAAHVGRLTGANGRPASFADGWLVQHDAPTTHGTSGSPLFNGRGKVIAINAGGYVEESDEHIGGKKAEVARESPYKFAMRVDLLDAILR
jgi:hypothetical protein